MKLSENLRQQLFASGPWHGGSRAFAAGAAAPALAAGDFPAPARHRDLVVRCTVGGAESLGCLLSDLDVALIGAAWTDGQLTNLAQQAAHRIGYLLERLTPIEHDRVHHRIMLRSDFPRKSGDRASYFELLANADATVQLRRYTFELRKPGRSQVDFSLTADQFEILVDDLVDICAKA